MKKIVINIPKFIRKRMVSFVFWFIVRWFLMKINVGNGGYPLPSLIYLTSTAVAVVSVVTAVESVATAAEST